MAQPPSAVLQWPALHLLAARLTAGPARQRALASAEAEKVFAEFSHVGHRGPTLRLPARGTRLLETALVALLAAVAAPRAAAQTATQPHAAPPAQAGALMRRGAEYLLATQEQDGGWPGPSRLGISALCVKALAQTRGIGPEHLAVRRGGDFVLRSQRDDGGIYSADGLYKSYETSVALSMLIVLKTDRYKDHIARAQQFLKDQQWDEGEGKSADDEFYGGAGYGSSERPDLSNTQIMLDALHDSGLPKDDPAYQKALVFIQRCQMLGESNGLAFAKGSRQGGFIYSPVAGGESKAGTIGIDGRPELRCYGSMTYAGFKSMLYAGLTRDDPRVKAALDWIGRYWTLEYNPNMPEKQSRQGLYYYYHTFARALAAWGEPTVKDRLGRAHDWRRELVDKLASLQKPDGSWTNDADRWMEGAPALTTAYALLALQAAFP